MTSILLFSLVLICLGIIETLFHRYNLKKIPIRIHVNGSRGKSTITRLIAGGLREAGFKVIAKTTGTSPRLIMEDGSEIPLKRRGLPRITEQLRVVSIARKKRAEVLVVECMAIKPEMQWTSEVGLIKSHLGVITNVRHDHCEEMGWNMKEIAETLSLTIPVDGKIVTTEERYLNILTIRANEVNAIIYKVDGSNITEDEVSRFSYLPFKENIACALKVCELIGIKKEVAIKGMWKAEPDPGVLKVYKFFQEGRKIYLINAMAANDLTSTRMVWKKVYNSDKYQYLKNLNVIGVFNNRTDRMTRLRDLATFIKETEMRQVILIGESKRSTYLHLRKWGIEKNRIKISPKNCITKELFKGVLKSSQDTVIFAFGNIKGTGIHLVEFFKKYGVDLI